MNNHVDIVGKIEGVRSYQGTYYYDVVLPAHDEYSRPASVQLSADRKIGAVGDEVEVTCSIHSYYRTFTTKDGEQGRDYSTRFQVL